MIVPFYVAGGIFSSAHGIMQTILFVSLFLNFIHHKDKKWNPSICEGIERTLESAQCPPPTATPKFST